MLIAHKPLADTEIAAKVIKLNSKVTENDISLDIFKTEEYIDSFENWILSSSYNSIVGLGEYSYKAYCIGTYDAIQSFVSRHTKKKRIRFSKAEFVGAKICSNFMNADWTWLEDEELCENDAVILSLPFSGNGSLYPDYDDLIETCTKLDIPVFLDLAYYGISHGLKIDLSPECITDVTTSLSKPMSVPLRAGVRFCRQYYDDVIQGQSDMKIFNRIAVCVATELINEYSHNWLMQKYLPKNLDVCKKLELEPTSTITLAIGNQEKTPDFNRNGYYRVCITDELLQGI